jgi:outer membrane protein OmpA-like peptidoglycan-associated protein
VGPEILYQWSELMRRFVVVGVLGVMALSGCASLSQTERGAVIGATGGAAIGAVIGRTTGDAGRGAVVGAAVGAATGAVIGRQMDRQAETLREEMENAKIEQEGEEIRITFDSGILFDTDRALLRPEAIRNLQVLAASLREYPGHHVEISGHTDSRGSAAHNQSLSERRAASAADFLVSEGVPRSSIISRGYGFTRPVDTNDTAAGRQNNRRVEVRIYASDEYRRSLEQQ